MTTIKDILNMDTNMLESFQSFSMLDTALSLVAAFLIGMFIYYIYQKTYSGVLYSHSFNVSLVALVMITALIICGVTTNITLSLGMVGALSIVRFRTAIKDPVDLVFLFWAIAEGILCGASLLPLALIGCPLVGIFLLVFCNKKQRDNPYLLIMRLSDTALEEKIYGILEQSVRRMALKSKTVTGGSGNELIFEVRPKDGKSDFVNTISEIAGVESVVMVSYDGNYAA